jgi:hypothetical protein
MDSVNLHVKQTVANISKTETNIENVNNLHYSYSYKPSF